MELVKIAGYMHDIGNAINRTHHAEYGALLANDLLKGYRDMSLEDRITVMSAIRNHDESTGDPEDVISAALIIADKTDVRRSQVRQKSNQLLTFMIVSIMRLQIQNLRSQKIGRLLHLIFRLMKIFVPCMITLRFFWRE